MRSRIGLGVLLLLGPLPCPAPACSLCNFNLQSSSFREDAALAKLVLVGKITASRLEANTSDLSIEKVIKSDPFLGDKKTLELPRYIPVLDPKNPPSFLIFCDVFKGTVDPYRGVPVESAAIVEYLQGALALDAKDRAGTLLYYFKFLDHAEEKLANDAFLEIAKASDQELLEAAGKFSAEKLRGWIKDPRTPLDRLSLYGFLLGACGGERDADLLETLLKDPGERTVAAMNGLLSGYVQLRPRAGWDLVQALLRDEKKTVSQRTAALQVLRFFHSWKPEQNRNDILAGLGAALGQGDVADIAIEEMRRWQLWDLSGDVLAQYGKKSHGSPIVQDSIVRYALQCPREEARQFLSALRARDPGPVERLEKSLELEKQR